MGVTWLALSLALGIAIGRWWPESHAGWWIAAGALGAGLARLTKTRSPRKSFTLLMTATVAFGAAWYAVRYALVSPDDLSAWVDEESHLVHARGIALGGPSRRDRTAGSLGGFDYRPPSTYFPMKVTALIGRDGRETAVHGNVYVGVTETVAPFRAGDRVEARGYLRTPGPPSNPGEFDVRRLARTLGQAGTINVPSRELLTMTPADRFGLQLSFINLRETVRRRASGWLLSGLPGERGGERDALLAALLLGQRELEFEGVSERFRRVGLAHLLAISGLHLGVLAGFVALVLRLFGTSTRGQGLIIILVVISYLFLVEVRLPVLRAGVMIVCASVAMTTGRRLRVSGLVGLSAILLLLWRPDQLFTAGFQLSFGVVLGIIHLSPRLRARWFGPADMVVASTMQMVGQWMLTLIAVTITAWMVALPITIHHFGMVAPMSIPLSIVALPIVSMLLAIGYLKMMLTAILPSVALLLGVPLSIGTDYLLSMIEAIDTLPGSALHVPFPDAWWTVAALFWVCLFVLVRHRALRNALWIVPAALGFLLFWTSSPGSGRETLRIDMLAVGDGSCYVIRSEGRCAIFDAGSSTDFDAGAKIIVPALRRLGVHAVDFIAISHSNTDHCSSVLEIVDEFPVGEVLVTPQLLEAARLEAGEPTEFLLDQLIGRRVRIETVAAGHVRTVGATSWTWIHPGPGQRFDNSNDSSMVIRIEEARHAAILCGDIQRASIRGIVARAQQGEFDLSASIVELPHHGSFNDDAASLIRRIDPRVVLQSTGRRRWRTDRWAEVLAGRTLLVTARDGACTVRVDQSGDLVVDRFLDH